MQYFSLRADARRVVIACIAMFAFSFGCRTEAFSALRDSILIGVSMGAETPSGVSAVRSMRMAVEEINAAGGIDGRKIALAVRYGNAKDAASMDKTVHELIDAGAQMIMSGSGSANTVRAAKIAVQRGVMLMTGASTSPQISEIPDSNLVWRTIPSDVFQGNLAAAALRRLKHERVGVIFINNPYGGALAKAFREAFTQKGGKVVASVSYPDIESYQRFHFAPLLDSLYAKKPSAVYVVSYNDDGAELLNDSKRYFSPEYKPFLLGCDGNYNSDFLIAVEPEVVQGMEGLAYVHPKDYANFETFMKKFKEFSRQSLSAEDLANITLSNMLDVESTNSYAATSYDAVYVFALAALKASLAAKRAPTPQEIAKEMRAVANASPGASVVSVGEFAKAANLLRQGKTVNYEGASGSVEFDARGDVSQGTYVLWRIIDGQFIETGSLRFP
jgi:ABC-type branched-subunit amino acid transport system substrate-binding protein